MNVECKPACVATAACVRRIICRQFFRTTLNLCRMSSRSSTDVSIGFEEYDFVDYMQTGYSLNFRLDSPGRRRSPR